MANAKHVALLKSGVDAWNTWRLKHPNVQPDLSSTNLEKARLSEAFLQGADLRQAILSEADLRGASLGWANLSEAIAFRAKLKGAILIRADLRGTILRSADLNGARLGECVFGDTDLRRVTGLAHCHYDRPSTIDHRTLLKSGRLPRVFLRGCGLPDQLIEGLPSLLSHVPAFESCFISYATRDQAFADRLHADLQARGVRCWFAPHNVEGGKKLHEQIDEAIRFYDRLLLIISRHSMRSEWVKSEIAQARQKEVHEGRQVLFPVRLVPFENIRGWKLFDADTGKDSAREIREYFIPDFSEWKDRRAYDQALKTLITALKA